MVFRHSSGIRHSCMRHLSRGVFPGREQAMQWDAARAKQVLPRSLTSLPQFLSKLPEKNLAMHIIITKHCIKKYPSAKPARRKPYLPNRNANVADLFKSF